MNKKFTSTIAGASIFITIMGLVSRGLGLIREVVFANFFGLSVEFDLYLIGTVFPITINTIILYLAQNYFIPNYNRIKQNSSRELKNFTSSTFWLFFLGSAVITLILFVFAESILKFYFQQFTEDSLNSTVLIFRIFILTMPLSAGVSVLSAYLQSEYEFRYPILSQLLLNVAVILLVLFLTDTAGVLSIPLGYLAGTIVQFVYLLVKSKNGFTLNLFESFRGRISFQFLNSTFVFIILIEIIGQLYLLADRFLYKYVETGGIAALNFAFNIYILPVSIISAAISTAIFPRFSESIASNSLAELSQQLKNFFSINLFMFVPITIVLIFYGETVITLLFQRGEFSSKDTIMTNEVLQLFSLSLIFYSSYAVLSKVIYSGELVKQLLYIAIAGGIIKIVLNFVLAEPFRQNGLALSTSVSFIFFAIASLVLILLKIKLNLAAIFSKDIILSLSNGVISYSLSVLIPLEELVSDSIITGLLRIIIFSLIYYFNSRLIEQRSAEMISSAFEILRR